MLSACASINRGMAAILAAERAADHDMMARVTKQEQQSRHQHAALQAAGGRLEQQSRALQSQEAAIAHLATALNGPGGLQDRLADMQGALQRVVTELALIEEGMRTGASAPVSTPRPRMTG